MSPTATPTICPTGSSIGDRDQLIVPYTLDANDMRFATPQGFNAGATSSRPICATASTRSMAEGRAGAPKMLSIGLHCRLIGRPGRIAGLRRFLEYARSHQDVWFARRIDIAEHWSETHPHKRRTRPSQMNHPDFVAAYGGIFEHSPWIAERAHDAELGPAHDTASGLHSALALVFRAASEPARLGVLTAHPDLAGKLAAAKRLTAESTAEQAGAGLDALTDAERARFTELNDRLCRRFGFPFIIAVRDHDKAGILAAFEARIDNDRDTEFATACAQVERIAFHRLKDMLP